MEADSGGVPVFKEDEACAYLESALNNEAGTQDEYRALTRALRSLPLALAQTAAYMLDRGLSCTDYHCRLTNRRRAFATLVPEPDSLPGGHQATVAATWSLSLEYADQLRPVGLAMPLLQLASHLDPHGIPASVFAAGAATGLLMGWTRRPVDADDVHDGLRCQARLSLIDANDATTAGAVRVHALVQRGVLEGSLAPRGRTRIVAATALLQAWSETERDVDLARVLRANVQALNESSSEHLWSPDAHDVLFRLGRSLGNCGMFSDVAAHFEKLHKRVLRR